MSDPRSLVVLGFDNQLAAQEMLTTLTRLSTEGTLLLQDAVFVTKADNGKVRVVQTTDPSSGQAAVGGAWWGLLFGVLLAVPVLGMAIGAGSAALMARMIDTGISDKFVKELRDSIEGRPLLYNCSRAGQGVPGGAVQPRQRRQGPRRDEALQRSGPGHHLQPVR